MRSAELVPEPVCNSLSSIPETWQGYCVTSALSATSRLHLCEGLSGFAVHTVAGAAAAALLVLRSRRPRRTAAILSLPILRGPLCLTVSSSTPGLLGFAPAECLFAAAKCIFAALVSPRPILRGPLGLTISRDSLPTLLLPLTLLAPPNASSLTPPPSRHTVAAAKRIFAAECIFAAAYPPSRYIVAAESHTAAECISAEPPHCRREPDVC